MCAPCHGLNLASTGSPAPELRESAIALNMESMWAVMHEGVLMSRGMPRYEGLTQAQVRQLQAYIRAGAREVLGTRKPAVNDQAAPARF